MKRLYEKQMDQTNILNEIVTITNISRGLIDENKATINMIIDTLLGINETIINIELLLNSQAMIHHSGLRTWLKQMKHDTIFANCFSDCIK